MPYDIHDKRRASIHAILSFCAFAVIVVLLVKYAGREIEISTTHDDDEKKVNISTPTIICVTPALMAYIYIFLASLIIAAIKFKAWVDAYADVLYFGPRY